MLPTVYKLSEPDLVSLQASQMALTTPYRRAAGNIELLILQAERRQLLTTMSSRPSKACSLFRYGGLIVQ